MLLPGERITDDVIEYLRSLKAVGARLHGASDPDFATICVFSDAECMTAWPLPRAISQRLTGKAAAPAIRSASASEA